MLKDSKELEIFIPLLLMIIVPIFPKFIISNLNLPAMKIFYFSLLIIFISSACPAQYLIGSNDSLLFDGSKEYRIIPTERTADCKIMVTFAAGTVEGVRYETKIYEICGEEDTALIPKQGIIQKNDVLKIGEDITTGDNGNLEIELFDGSLIRMGPNSKVKITGDMCDSRTVIEQKAGKIWNNVKKLLGGQKYEVKTERNGGGVRGTIFSIEVTADEEIIKVYEGSFVVNPPTKNTKLDKNSTDLEKLYKDYQAGKITIEEYTAKMKEFTENITKTIKDSTPKVCEAGFMVKVTDVISDPVPIESSGKEWFDDSNFK